MSSFYNSPNLHAIFWTSWPDNLGAVAVQLDKMIINAYVTVLGKRAHVAQIMIFLYRRF